MDIVVAADTGIVKGITLSTNAVVNYGDLSSLRPNTDGITCMSWTGDDQTEVLCASVDRQLRLFDCLSTEDATAVKPMFAVTCGIGDVRAALTYNKGQSIATASTSGTIGLYDLRGQLLGQWESGDQLKRMRRREHVVVTCGDEHPMKLWDMNTVDTKAADDKKPTPTFTSKNVAHDWLQLRVPVCDNDVRFVPRSPLVITCTKTKEIRKYDPRAQRRPVAVMTSDSDYPLMCVDVVDHDGNAEYRCVAGDTQGRMAAYDWRGKPGMTHVFRSFAGACRDIVCHPTHPLVASCALDRFTRVHHIDDKVLIDKVYCKTRLTCLLMRDTLSIVRNNGHIVRSADRAACVDTKKESADAGVKDEENESGSGGESDDGVDVWDEIATKARAPTTTDVKEHDSGAEHAATDEPVAKKSKKNPIKSLKRANNGEMAAEVSKKSKSGAKSKRKRASTADPDATVKSRKVTPPVAVILNTE